MHRADRAYLLALPKKIKIGGGVGHGAPFHVNITIDEIVFPTPKVIALRVTATADHAAAIHGQAFVVHPMEKKAKRPETNRMIESDGNVLALELGMNGFGEEIGAAIDDKTYLTTAPRRIPQKSQASQGEVIVPHDIILSFDGSAGLLNEIDPNLSSFIRVFDNAHSVLCVGLSDADQPQSANKKALPSKGR